MSKRERQSAARRRGRTGRQKEARRAQAMASLVVDPATEPDRAAAILYETYGDEPVAMAVVATIAAAGGLERARAVAQAALSRAHGPLALSLAADVALLDGRSADAEEHVVEALELTESPDLSLRLAAIQAGQGRLEEAIDVLETELKATPYLLTVQNAYGDLLAEGQRLGSAPGALRRFRDRTSLRQLLAELGRFVGGDETRSETFATGLQVWVEEDAVTDDELTDWTDRATRDPGSPVASSLQLMGEWAWLLPHGEDKTRSLLDAFAADPSLSDDMRRRAADWLGWAMWGLWEIARPVAAPGVLVTELMTGLPLYVEAPSALLEGLPRWSVVLGCMLPVDGVWRIGGGWEVATPLEARELVHELIDGVLASSRAFGREGKAAVTWARQVHDEFDELWMSGAREMPAEALVGLQAAMRSSVPSLVATLRRLRGPVRRWFTLDVDDPDAAMLALARHEKFEFRSGELTWFEPVDEPGEGEDPRRPRATFSVEDDDLMVELEPGELVADVVDLLATLGHPALPEEAVGEDDRPEPPVTLPGLTGEELTAWLHAWPDVELDILDEHTPREALEEHQARAEVEMMIRYLEHEADRRGLGDLDTDGLRKRLGLLAEED